MNKKELVSLIGRHTWLREPVINNVIDAFFTEVTFALYRGEKVNLGSFGSFKPQKRAARIGRNPHTGDAVPIPARIMPVFKAGSSLRKTVSQKEI